MKTDPRYPKGKHVDWDPRIKMEGLRDLFDNKYAIVTDIIEPEKLYALVLCVPNDHDKGLHYELTGELLTMAEVTARIRP